MVIQRWELSGENQRGERGLWGSFGEGEEIVVIELLKSLSWEGSYIVAREMV